MASSRSVLRLLRAVVGALPRTGTRSQRERGPRNRPAPPTAPSSERSPRYAGDHEGAWTPVYAPDLDGEPDPGEVVWAWVPFEEDHSRGKDRPVLVVGRDGDRLLALMLSSRDHDASPGRRGERWLDLGSGTWDAQGRPSEVRLDRVLRLDPAAVRREGAVLERSRFDTVVAELRRRT